jgi:hypothetical protein
MEMKGLFWMTFCARASPMWTIRSRSSSEAVLMSTQFAVGAAGAEAAAVLVGVGGTGIGTAVGVGGNGVAVAAAPQPAIISNPRANPPMKIRARIAYPFAQCSRKLQRTRPMMATANRGY